MKTTIFKIVLPVAFAAIAIFGAFSTNAMSKDSKVLMNQFGYVTINEDQPCHVQVSCRTEFGPICKSGTLQAWGKLTPTSVNCNVELYKIPN